MPESGPGRPSPMDVEENRRRVAELYADGATREQIGEVFGVHKDTVTKWTKRADVQAIVSEIRQQRANRILRRVEAAIEGRLSSEASVSKMDLKDLLAIVREFRPQRIEVGRAGDFSEQAELAAWDQLDRGEAPLELPAGDVEEDEGGE